MKKVAILLSAALLMGIVSSCTSRCHCYGLDGSHSYFTKEELKERNTTCTGMETVSSGLIYSICEYDNTSY